MNSGPAVAALRHAIVWQWVLAALSVGVFRLEAPFLPDAFQVYALQEATRPVTGFDAFVGVFAFAWATTSLIASAGVFLLKPWSRHLYAAMALLGIALTAMLEPSITASWSAAAETSAQIAVGVALGLLYLSPAGDAFSRG